jgi:hypothetical protein
VERRSPGWRPGRRLSIYVAYLVWVWPVRSGDLWLDRVGYQAGSWVERGGVLVFYSSVRGLGSVKGVDRPDWGEMLVRKANTKVKARQRLHMDIKTERCSSLRITPSPIRHVRSAVVQVQASTGLGVL